MKVSALFAGALATLLLSSCSSDTSESGFLTNYSQLGSDLTRFDSAAVYLHPTADFEEYDSVLVEEVAIIPGGVVVADLEREQIAARLQSSLVTALAEDYEIVTVPGAKTMRVRTALVGDLDDGKRGSSKRYTYPRAQVRDDLPDPSPVAEQVGLARVELEVRDSLTGERLVAIADKEIGDLDPRARETTETWDDISKMMDKASKRLADRLTDLRARIIATESEG